MAADYARKFTKPEQLLARIVVAMGHIERLDLRIATIYLHPVCVKLIEREPALDRIWDPRLKQTFPGLVGALYGMQLFESDLVPEEHVAFIPDGIEGKLVSSAACFPL